mgnify:CR=1 FL=1
MGATVEQLPTSAAKPRKPRAMRRKWSAEALKALPWLERVRVTHGILDGTEACHDSIEAADAFSLCIRRTWPKGRPWPTMVFCAKSDGWHSLTGERGEFGMPEVDYKSGPLKCGTPAGLYRLAYLVKPRRVDFGDMYKCGLFRLFSPDRRVMCRVELFKYELTLYFYCRKEDRFAPEPPAMPEVFRAQPQTQDEADHWHDAQTGGWALLVDAHAAEWDAYLLARDAYEHQGIIEREWSSELVSCKSAAGRAWMALVVKAANRQWGIYGGNDFEV